MKVRRIGGEEEGSERIRPVRSFVGPFVYNYGYCGGGGGGDGERDGGGEMSFWLVVITYVSV